MNMGNKREHTEPVKDIQIREIDYEEEGTETAERTKLGIYQCYCDNSPNLQLKRLELGVDGKTEFPVTDLESVTFVSFNNWAEGIEPGIMEFLVRLVEQEKAVEPADEARKYKLKFWLTYAHTDEQEATFGKNLSALLSVPGWTECIGAFTYSVPEKLADFLGRRFPQLLHAKPNFPCRYDVRIYCENDTLIEEYYTDVKHWLFDLNNEPSSTTSDMPIRQCRICFFNDRVDNAEDMLKLLTHDFTEDTVQRTFVVRLDCPDFSLTEFELNNEKTNEILMLTLKSERQLDIEDGDRWLDEPKKEAESDASSAKKFCEKEEDANDGDEYEIVMVTWRSYMLIRCPASPESQKQQLMDKYHIPVLNRSWVL